MDHVKRKIIIKYITVQIKYTKIKGNYKEEWHKLKVPLFLSLMTFFRKIPCFGRISYSVISLTSVILKKPVCRADCLSFLHLVSVSILVMCLIKKRKAAAALKKILKTIT